MSTVVLSLPKINDSELVFDETETREILAFFWPASASAIKEMAITNDVRRFAQGLLIVAVDASYAMGYIDILVNVLFRRKPGASIKSLVKKLVKKNVRHWWKHATRHDLRDAKIYDTVRSAIALKQRSRFELFKNGLASSSQATKHTLVVLSASTRSAIWV